MAFRIRAEVLMRFAGYNNDEIQNMNDIAVFRRFFVVQNIINEILRVFAGGSEESSSVPSEYSNPNRYGEDPFTAKDPGDQFGFPSTI